MAPDVEPVLLESLDHTRLESLQLDSLSTPRHKLQSVFQRCFRRLVGLIRHVDEEIGGRDATTHGFEMVDHVPHGHLLLVFVTQDVGAQAVADENNIDASFLLDERRGIVVACEDDDTVAVPLPLLQLYGFVRHDVLSLARFVLPSPRARIFAVMKTCLAVAAPCR